MKEVITTKLIQLKQGAGLFIKYSLNGSWTIKLYRYYLIHKYDFTCLLSWTTQYLVNNVQGSK